LGVPRDDSKPGSGRTAVVVWPKGLTVMAFDGVESMEEKRRSCTLTWPRAEPCRFLDAGLRMVSTRSAQISEGARKSRRGSGGGLSLAEPLSRGSHTASMVGPAKDLAVVGAHSTSVVARGE